MGGQSEATRKSDEITAPVAGQISVIAVSGSAGSQDLAAIGPQTGQMQNEDALPNAGSYQVAGSATVSGSPLQGCIGHFVEFFAETADVGILFGPTNASVTSASAPALATTGTNTAGCCMRIPAGTYRTFYIHAPTRFVGFVGSTSGNLRISVTSRG